jgi:hypothetical protein
MAIKFGALDWNKIGALFGHYRAAAGRRIFSACFVPRQKNAPLISALGVSYPAMLCSCRHGG